MREKKWLYFFIFSFIFLFCFRPLPAFRLYTELDDSCYATWAARFLGLFPDRCSGAAYPPGAGLLWFPASVVTVFRSGWNAESFLQQIPVAVGILSFVYWCLSVIGFRSFVFTLSVPVLYYAIHRTTMVHAPEIFLASVLVFCLQKRQAWWALFISSVLVLLRLNDAPALLFPLWMFFEKQGKENENIRIPKLRFGKWLSFILFVLCFIGLIWMGLRGYQSTYLSTLLHRVLSLKRWKVVLLGSDWGLLFTAPFWLGCFSFGIFHFRRLTRLSQIGLLWLLFELLVCVGWRGSGSDFAYRYLIGSYAGVFLLWEEMKAGFPRWKVVSSVLLNLNAFILFWLTWVYKEFPAVTPVSIPGHTWTKPHLLWNAAKGLCRVKYYVEPFLHSAISTLYFTWKKPASPYAFEGDQAAFLSTVLAVCVGLCAGVILFVAIRKIVESSKLKQ